jgi:uncharacterized protein
MRFEWDEKKDAGNRRKHKVSFVEAATVFRDELAWEYPDPDHSVNEHRFLMLGMSHLLRVLVVAYCLRKEESVIRIISARAATRNEQRFYERTGE